MSWDQLGTAQQFALDRSNPLAVNLPVSSPNGAPANHATEYQPAESIEETLEYESPPIGSGWTGRWGLLA